MKPNGTSSYFDQLDAKNYVVNLTAYDEYDQPVKFGAVVVAARGGTDSLDYHICDAEALAKLSTPAIQSICLKRLTPKKQGEDLNLPAVCIKKWSLPNTCVARQATTAGPHAPPPGPMFCISLGDDGDSELRIAVCESGQALFRFWVNTAAPVSPLLLVEYAAYMLKRCTPRWDRNQEQWFELVPACSNAGTAEAAAFSEIK